MSMLFDAMVTANLAFAQLTLNTTTRHLADERRRNTDEETKQMSLRSFGSPHGVMFQVLSLK